MTRGKRVTRELVVDVKKCRERFPGMTQLEIAKFCGTSETTVGRILSGQHDCLLVEQKEPPQTDERAADNANTVVRDQTLFQHQMNKILNGVDSVHESTAQMRLATNRLSQITDFQKKQETTLIAMQDGLSAQIETLTEVMALMVQQMATLVEIRCASSNPKWKASPNYMQIRKQNAEQAIQKAQKHIS